MSLAKTLRSGTRCLKYALGFHTRPAQPLAVMSEEPKIRYCEGGYHPVRIGDHFGRGKYRVVSKLGYGIYSTVWLAFDRENKRHVALKVLTSDCIGGDQSTFELAILRHIKTQRGSNSGSNHILQLLDDFEHRGPNGNHICLVFPPMGPDMSRYRRLFSKSRISLPLMKDVSRQLLMALSYLHDTCKVIHTDIKPQNILIETAAIRNMFEKAPSVAFQSEGYMLDPPDDFYMESSQVSSAEEDLTNPTSLSIRLADFGTASWFDRHLTEWIQPDKLRAPEVILGADWDYKVDIWNVGLIIWELAQGQLLFDGMWTSQGCYSADAHLAQMSTILGAFPKRLLERCTKRDQYFDAAGNLLRPSTFQSRTLDQINALSGLSELEKREFLGFIGAMVTLDPEDRLDASKLLESPWLS